MAEHRDGHDHPDRAAGLERGPDGEAVHHAVPDQGGPGEQADTRGVQVARVLPLVPTVDRHRALDDVQGQEADDGGEQGQPDAEQLAGLLAERFGHQVEGDHPEHEPGGEPEDEVLVVAEPQGREPTGQGGDE